MGNHLPLRQGYWKRSSPDLDKEVGGKPGGCWQGSQERRESEKQGEVQDCQMWREVKLGKSGKAHIELSNMEFPGDLGWCLQSSGDS